MRGPKRYQTPMVVGTLLCLAAGCTEPAMRAQRARFEVLIEADSAVRSEIVDVEARLERREPGDVGWRLRSAQHFYPSRSSDWPIGFMTDPETPSQGAKYHFVAIARDSHGAVVAQARVVIDYESARRAGIRVLFDTRCLRLTELCGAELTCRGGDCVSAIVDPDDPLISTSTGADTAAEDAGSKARDTSAIASANTPCEQEGERRCADFASTTPLLCSAGSWRSQPECGTTQRCDTSDGPTRGMCRAIAPECAEHEPLAPFCDGEAMRVCDSDLLKSMLRLCSENERCAPGDDGEARCSCRAGFVKIDQRCEQATNCDTDNGGCDLLTQCSATARGRSCGPCPSGWAGTGESGCIPALIQLKAENAALTPDFSPDVLKYELRVGLLQQKVTLSAVAPESTNLTFNGEPAVSGEPWTSPVLALGENVVEVQLSSEFGVSKNYRVIVRREGVQQAYLKASHPSQTPIFGYAVAAFEDTVVVGVPYEDVAASGVNGTPSDATAQDSGAVYVYVRDGDDWSLQAYLKAPSVRSRGYLGYALAIYGDTLAVGVPNQLIPGPATAAGSVYIYTRSNGSWSFQTELAASDSEAGDGFGYFLTLEADRLVVGAPTQITRGLRGGAAYAFTRAGGKWTEQQRITASEIHAYSAFGAGLALSGDTLVVGAHTDNSGSGAAYVFTFSNGRWTQRQELPREPLGSNVQFGYGLALKGNTLAVGVPGSDSIPGEVHVYRYSDNLWTRAQVLTAPAPNPSDLFGYVLAINEDALLVGAPGDRSSARGLAADPTLRDAPKAGAAYLFTRASGGYRLSTYLKASDARAEDYFGASVGLANDVLVVGAPFEASSALGINPSSDDTASPSAGAAYVFH